MNIQLCFRCILAVFFICIAMQYSFEFIYSNPSREDLVRILGHQSYRSPHMIQLDWTRMQPSHLEDVYTFISGYYDNRLHISDRPAVVILAYVAEKVSKPALRCFFTYSNGTVLCLNHTTPKVEKPDCSNYPFIIRKVDFRQILCPLHQNEDVPEFVQMSSSADCTKDNLSGKIKVRNDGENAETKPSKIGVCVHSSLREQGSSMLHVLKNFISMCQFLGAGFVTLYASQSQVSKETIAYLHENYSDVVNLIEWRELIYDYNGQHGIIQECLHRHRHEAEYLAFFDLDEMILPMKHYNWPSMLNSLEQLAGAKYAGYSFLNRMYKRSENSHPGLSRCSNIDGECIYLSYLDERGCIFKHGHRSKLIVSTKYSVHVAVHEMCQFSGKKTLFRVNRDVAVSAHYRRKHLRQCYSYFSTNKLNHLHILLDKFVNDTCT